MPRGFPDWAAVAELVVEGQPRPVLVLDHAGFVRLVNRLGVEFLGASRERILGRHFRQLFLKPGDGDRFKDALRGALRRTEREVRTLDGRHLRVVLDLFPVGSGKKKSLLVTAMSSTTVHAESLPEDFDYDVSSDLSDFGRLQRVVAGGRRIPYLAGRFCYEALRNAKAACGDCPALHPGGDWPRVTVRRASGASGSYEVISATPRARSDVRLKVRRFTSEMLAAVFEARIAELANQADLTERERSVLKYLIWGRQISDIATILEISTRTVKFHQGNILRKLGADSRVDLMRLMM